MMKCFAIGLCILMQCWSEVVYSSEGKASEKASSLLNLEALTYQPSSEQAVPKLKREFRGAWMATVHNIDWPSKPGLPVKQQKEELLQILELVKKVKLNAVILQVRPACDAIYQSDFEPWSYYLTGKMGHAPKPFYDPLAFAIEECHKRGIELHAWFNPYRALASVKTKGRFVARSHISKKRPDLVKRYGNYLWLDPTSEEVREYSTKVIMDVVKRYDVDGVHMDDYFYPYPIWRHRKKVDFPDYYSWKKYLDQGGNLKRAAWRRSKVNAFISSLYARIKQEKPWVKFGVSPFGIWRPNFPDGIKTGIDAYEDLSADSRLWLKEGWVDYLSPQLYWPIESEGQCFSLLLNWWAEENESKRHVWPGISSSSIGPKRPAQESLNQIQLVRELKNQNKLQSSGHIHWSISSMTKNKRGLSDLLQSQSFAEEVLPPSYPWLSEELPAKPLMSLKSLDEGLQLQWNLSENGGNVWKWVCQWKSGDQWQIRVLEAEKRKFTIEQELASIQTNVVSLRGLDRAGNEGPAAIWTLQPIKPPAPPQKITPDKKPFWHFIRNFFLGSR